MGKLTDILIATAGLYEILTYHENQPTVIDRAVEKGVKLYHAGVGMYRIVFPEPPQQPLMPPEPKDDGRSVEDYRKKIADLSSRAQH